MSHNFLSINQFYNDVSFSKHLKKQYKLKNYMYHSIQNEHRDFHYIILISFHKPKCLLTTFLSQRKSEWVACDICFWTILQKVQLISLFKSRNLIFFACNKNVSSNNKET